jgi:UDP-glucuronate 4-epimerase
MARTSIVTGAAGFIGSHLSRALIARGDRVIGVDNYDPFYDRALKHANIADLPDDRFGMVEADIRDSERLLDIFRRERPDVVFHIAALAGVRPSIEQPKRYVAVNLDGLTSVLEAASAVDCRRFLFASSSSVYGNNEKVPFAEDDPVNEPISPYAATKAAGELICHSYVHLFGMSIAALRFFTVYGPAQRPDLAIGKFMRLIASGEEVPMFGDGSTSRDYTYIDDIIEGVLGAEAKVHQSPPGFFRIYNLGGSESITLRDMIQTIGEVIGCEPRITTLPMQPGDVEQTWADLTRSRKEIGYHPQTPFADGVRKQWACLCQRLESASPA